MPIRKHPVELPTHQRTAEPTSEETERQLVGDSVFQPRAVSAVGFHSVLVFPAAERAADLDIAETLAWTNVTDLGDPRKPKRTQADSDLDPLPFAQATIRAHLLDRLAGRSQACKSPRLGMPSEQALGRDGDVATAGENFGHGGWE